MTENEVKPLSGTAEVSPTDAAAKEKALLQSARKKKKADRTPEEQKAFTKYCRETRRISRAKQEARQDVANGKYNSKEEVSKKEAKRILAEERLIRNPRIQECCIELAEIACRTLKLPMNAHVFTHGIQKTLEAIATKKEVESPAIDDTWHAGERVREHELK